MTDPVRNRAISDILGKPWTQVLCSRRDATYPEEEQDRHDTQRPQTLPQSKLSCGRDISILCCER